MSDIAAANTNSAPNTEVPTISDQELAYWSQQTKLVFDTPEKQAKAKAGLEEMRPYMRMEITDPRFVEHAKHMGLDVEAVTQQLQGASTQLQAMEQNATQLGKDLLNDKKSARTQVLIGGIAGVVTGGLGAWFSSQKWEPVAEKLSGWKKGLAATGIGLLGTIVVSWGYDALMNGGNKTRIREGEQKLDTLVNQYAQSAEQIGNYVNEVRNVFVTTHLQRMFTEKVAPVVTAAPVQETTTPATTTAVTHHTKEHAEGTQTHEKKHPHEHHDVANTAIAGNASYSNQLPKTGSDMASAPHSAPIQMHEPVPHHEHQAHSGHQTPVQPETHIQPPAVKSEPLVNAAPNPGFTGQVSAPIAHSYADNIRREPGNTFSMAM